MIKKLSVIALCLCMSIFVGGSMMASNVPNGKVSCPPDTQYEQECNVKVNDEYENIFICKTCGDELIMIESFGHETRTLRQRLRGFVIRVTDWARTKCNPTPPIQCPPCEVIVCDTCKEQECICIIVVPPVCDKCSEEKCVCIIPPVCDVCSEEKCICVVTPSGPANGTYVPALDMLADAVVQHARQILIAAVSTDADLFWIEVFSNMIYAEHFDLNTFNSANDFWNAYEEFITGELANLITLEINDDVIQISVAEGNGIIQDALGLTDISINTTFTVEEEGIVELDGYDIYIAYDAGIFVITFVWGTVTFFI